MFDNRSSLFLHTGPLSGDSSSEEDTEVSNRLTLASQVSVVTFLGIWCNVWKLSCCRVDLTCSVILCVCVCDLRKLCWAGDDCVMTASRVWKLSLSLSHTYTGLSPRLSCSQSVMHCVLTLYSSDVIWEWTDGWRGLMKNIHVNTEACVCLLGC